MLKTVISVMLLILLTACSNKPVSETGYFPEFQQASFARYVQDTTDWLKHNRRFIGDNPTREVELNAPFERMPLQPNGKAVLLVHGLTDSP